MRLGLCCIFQQENIRFSTRQAGYIAKFSRKEQLDHLATTILHNATSLMRALEYCWHNDVGCFRINSKILPLKSHPSLGYNLAELPESELISELFTASKEYSRKNNLRLTFHPDQFTLLSTPRKDVLEQSFAELRYHAEIAELVGADVITLHGGGAYGDKPATLNRLTEVVKVLPEDIHCRLALENDDRVYTPADLLPMCEKTGLPFVYDVHHHRCLSDGMSSEEVTERAIATWNREPLFHVSSPREGWQSSDKRPHHDFLDRQDMPDDWLEREITVEVEAKAKELAIARLQSELYDNA